MKRRVFIFEGVDGTGKSTAAGEMSAATGAHLVHTGPPPKTVIPMADVYTRQLIDALHHPGSGPVVFDRLHLGERVYGDILRKNDRLGEFGQELFETRAKHMCDPVLIMCRPPMPIAEANWRGRRERELVQTSTLWVQMYARYAHLRSLLTTHTFDYTTQDITKVLRGYM